MKKDALVLLLLFLVVSMKSSAQNSTAAPKKRSRSSQHETQKYGKANTQPKLQVAPDIDQELAKWQVQRMPFTAAGLTARERQLVEKLVQAQHYIEDIFWRQSDPDGLELYKRLIKSANPADRKLVRMLKINGSRFDLLKDNAPFVGTQPMPPGRGFFPVGVTREQLEKYVADHPDKKAAIYGPFTVVRRNAAGDLEGIPYHVQYRQWLVPAAKLLREAAALTSDEKFAKYLRLRADALLNDNYYDSDVAWLELENPKFDVIFAPYETYTDTLRGVKTSYGGAVLVRNEEESAKLAVYQKYVPQIQDALPLAAEDRPSKEGHLSPMEVMDAPFRSGDLRHGYQAVADNLPNDPRIHQEKGSKQIFFKNFMDARVRVVVLPIAKALMRTDQAAIVSGEAYMADTLMHEIAHGLGPAFARKDGKQADIRESIGPLYSALEEAKADIVGLYGLKWLVDHDAQPKDRLAPAYAAHVADLFRTVRFSIAEAHGRGEMMEFNYMVEQKAITRDASGKYGVDMDRMPDVVASLAKELLQIEATGDRARAEAWFAKYEKMPTELENSLKALTGVPVDIDPVFSFPEPIE
jgi:hypothetical protein